MHILSKYQTALQNHPFELTDKHVSEKVNQIISENFAENNNLDTYKLLYSCLDLTSLNTTNTKEYIWKLAQRVNDFEGSNPEIDNVASICVYPNFVETVKEALTANVNIACVAGGFPSGQTFTEVKIAETALAVAQGADEIDVPINMGLFLNEEYEEMCDELTEIKFACHEARMKTILETGALASAEKIYKASILALYSGADFIKTSTGKGYKGATPEAAYLMCTAIKSYYDKTKERIGFKASGGISTIEDAVKYYTIVKAILGNEWCNKELFRIGTSKLADILLDKINK